MVGPVGFVVAWVSCGLATDGYSPVDEAISELAAVGAPTRVAMTIGFLVFAAGVGSFAIGCRPRLPGWSWLALGLAAAATLGAAIFPLSGEGRDFDAAHGAFAGAGYLFLALAPVLAVPAFRRRGQFGWMWWSAIAASIGALCLVASVLIEANGLFQRLGLTTVDVWIVALALVVMSHPPPDRVRVTPPG